MNGPDARGLAVVQRLREQVLSGAAFSLQQDRGRVALRDLAEECEGARQRRRGPDERVADRLRVPFPPAADLRLEPPGFDSVAKRHPERTHVHRLHEVVDEAQPKPRDRVVELAVAGRL